MQSVMDPSQASLLEFSVIQKRAGKYIRRKVQKLTKNNVLHNLFDADDLESVVLTKFYFSYLAPTAPNKYEYRGLVEEQKLFKTLITRTYIDELRKRKDEISRILLTGSILSLDAPIRDSPDFCLGDLVQSIDSILDQTVNLSPRKTVNLSPRKIVDPVVDEVMAKVMIGEAISNVVKESRTENMEHVANHATGNGEKPTSDGYSKNYLNGLEKRLKDKVLETLLDAGEE